jgi:hypothetical protein
MKGYLGAVVVALVSVHALAQSSEPLFIAPVYVEFTSSSNEEFANEVQELRRRIGESAGVQVGFSAFLNMQFRAVDFNRPIDASVLKPTLDELDKIVTRARSQKLPIHISIASGFFHGYNTLRESAIRADVRNAQWFSDGSIADPKETVDLQGVPHSAWMTPSRYAQPMRARMQESVRLVGQQLAEAMLKNPETVLSVSGDTEVELSFAQNLDPEGRGREGGQVLFADYSPFMVAEFRDWLRNTKYAADASPATDDNHDGHTFNQDFGQQFRTWRLRYFDESGAIPYERYRAMTQKLPATGPNFIDGGFDAPRRPARGSPFWKAWEEFRVRVVSNFVHDFAGWVTDGSRIPPSRFYTHQIPADYLFGGRDVVRLETSASPLETAFIAGTGSPGITVFNTYNGKTHMKTSSPSMFKTLQKAGAYWGILEYGPSVPAVGDENYYLAELRTLYSFHPTIIAPFAWTNSDEHQPHRIQNTAYERALRKFVQEAGNVIHR